MDTVRRKPSFCALQWWLQWMQGSGHSEIRHCHTPRGLQSGAIGRGASRISRCVRAAVVRRSCHFCARRRGGSQVWPLMRLCQAVSRASRAYSQCRPMPKASCRRPCGSSCCCLGSTQNAMVTSLPPLLDEHEVAVACRRVGRAPTCSANPMRRASSPCCTSCFQNSRQPMLRCCVPIVSRHVSHRLITRRACTAFVPTAVSGVLPTVRQLQQAAVPVHGARHYSRAAGRRRAASPPLPVVAAQRCQWRQVRVHTLVGGVLPRCATLSRARARVWWLAGLT